MTSIHPDFHTSGFTLAEVLITLGIIGVVAALTLPTLIQSYQEKVTVNKLKKVYSMVNQAYLRAVEEYGTIDNWFEEDSANIKNPDTGDDKFPESTYKNAQLLWHHLGKFMNITSECYTEDCLDLSTYYTLIGEKTYKPISFTRLSDGTDFLGGWITINVSTCKEGDSCGDFAVDINGNNTPPNQIGRDMFYFKLTKRGIVPFGDVNKKTSSEFPQMCNLKSTAKDNGYGCTAWVLYNENMDYLHCSDLSWDGIQKCK